MGGEKTIPSGILMPTLGSPPRGRGKGRCRYAGSASYRITPAWAGKRLFPWPVGALGGDHPRVGGEKTFISAYLLFQAGSPPRGRGKGVFSFSKKETVRITPAWAGKRRRGSENPRPEQDHPRVGGEKSGVEPCGSRVQGSPPRGRGKVRPQEPRRLQGGITPAWAGKRLGMLGLSKQTKDHPRVGGEKSRRPSTLWPLPGSPPRGRGKDPGAAKKAPGLGITPAWAGKSRRKSAAASRSWDHPRVGGEKTQSARASRSLKGSPPRGRGKVGLSSSSASRIWITPAWAGKRRRRHPHIV